MNTSIATSVPPRAKIAQWCEWLGMALCILGAATSLGMVFTGRTLWPDEAMLVFNLETRTLRNLVASPLDMCQTAPLLYLYVLKGASSLLGGSEWVYRLPSAFAYIFLLGAVWWMARNLFKVSYPWLCAGFCANLKVLLLYSTQAKPYIGEALLVILVLAGHDTFLKGKLSWWGLAIIWILFGMLGNPVWFAVAGCMTYEVLNSVLRKDWRLMGRCLGVGAIFSICMTIYFLAWLTEVAHSDGMQDYWRDSMLQWPTSFAAIFHSAKIVWVLFAVQSFGFRAVYMVLLMGMSLFLGIWKKHRWELIVWLTFGAASGASCLNLFPISMRLWVFALPLCSLLVFWTVEQLVGRRHAPWRGVVLAGLAIANFGIVRWNPWNNYLYAREVNDSIAFVQEHLQDGESVYVHFEAFARVQYKNGYGNLQMGPTSRDNVIFGGTFEQENELEREVSLVQATGSCWLIMAHRLPQKFLDLLGKTGTLEIVHEFQGTPVFYYRNNETCGTGTHLGEDNNPGLSQETT